MCVYVCVGGGGGVDHVLSGGRPRWARLGFPSVPRAQHDGRVWSYVGRRGAGFVTGAALPVCLLVLVVSLGWGGVGFRRRDGGVAEGTETETETET